MKALTYPARPIKGGPPDLTRFEDDVAIEPKYNGWRALVHVPSGTMFNRHGLPLSIAREFTPALLKLQRTPFTWLDVEALDRRHGHARGTLIILDWVQRDLVYQDRRAFLQLTQEFPGATLGMEEFLLRDSVYLTPSWSAAGRELIEEDFPSAESITAHLQQCNQRLGCTFYEGLVAKKIKSHYPLQLRSPEEETPAWVKHRFTTN